MDGMDGIKQRSIVLFAGPYSITDDRTGAVTNEGISLLFIPKTTLTPQFDSVTQARGLRPAKATLPMDMLRKVTVAPAIYDVILGMTVNAKLQPIMKVVDINFVSEFDIVDIN